MSPSVFWLLFAILLFITEIITPFFLFSLFSISALITSFFSLFFPGLIIIQILIFVLLSTLFTFTIRRIFIKYLSRDDKGGIKTNVDAYVGRVCKVIVTIDNSKDTGVCEIDGIRWKAHSEDGPIIYENSFAKIVKVEGAHLYVVKQN